MKPWITLLLAIWFLAAHSPAARAQSTEDRFHDLFVTAGYSTALGAGLGAAMLGLSEDPSSKLRYISVGASLGFVGGTIVGSYIVFSPLVATAPSKGDGSQPLLSENPRHDPGTLVVQPSFDAKTARLNVITGQMILARF